MKKKQKSKKAFRNQWALTIFLLSNPFVTLPTKASSPPVKYPSSNISTINPNTVSSSHSSTTSLSNIDLISFHAENLSTGFISLTWETKNEGDITHFVIQRSKDPLKNFINIGTMYTTGSGYYNYTDHSVDAGFFYRLMMVDKKGRLAYSKIIFISTTTQEQPITIKFDDNKLVLENKTSAGQSAKVELYNSSTQEMIIKEFKIPEGRSLMVQDLNTLSSGLYIITVENDQNIQQTKFIK
jgi:hypothetical protein